MTSLIDPITICKSLTANHSDSSLTSNFGIVGHTHSTDTIVCCGCHLPSTTCPVSRETKRVCISEQCGIGRVHIQFTFSSTRLKFSPRLYRQILGALSSKRRGSSQCTQIQMHYLYPLIKI